MRYDGGKFMQVGTQGLRRSLHYRVLATCDISSGWEPFDGVFSSELSGHRVSSKVSGIIASRPFKGHFLIANLLAHAFSQIPTVQKYPPPMQTCLSDLRRILSDFFIVYLRPFFLVKNLCDVRSDQSDLHYDFLGLVSDLFLIIWISSTRMLVHEAAPNQWLFYVGGSFSPAGPLCTPISLYQMSCAAGWQKSQPWSLLMLGYYPSYEGY